MSNRFAWAWKLTDLGVPTVLVYLGFLNAGEMSDRGKPIPDATAWETLVKEHSRALFPAEVWNRAWSLKGSPLVPLIRSLEMKLENLSLTQ